ncbi:hypothetical protein [Paraburkholderia bryophila]|uniref:Uncharacterized protein n=1 Tax=Paraburkholderia bryophila TaxID=420952 RepID=A0A7Y9W722_9BURK|nr:hypothetical protein [Paraburkholderia bryophila]NYH15449.1 hypothetical protein [Paraburkholderia bryophila]
MARNKLITIILGSLLLVMLALVIAFNVLNLQEAYGGGPPHYSMTTNMDKWTNPLPTLGIIDGITLLIVAAYVYVLRTAQRKH